MAKKNHPPLRLLGGDGQPAAVAPGEEAPPNPGADQPAPIALESRVLSIKDGPLTLRLRLDFDNLRLGGPHVEQFVTGIDAVLNASSAFGVRLIELMFLAAAHNEAAEASQVVAEALANQRHMRLTVEGLMERISTGKGLKPSGLVVAQPGDVPPKAP